MRVTLMLSALLWLTTTSATGDEPLVIVVSPLISFAPTDMTIRTRIVPNDENRTLEIVAESDEFYRSSQIPLEGERAPAMIVVEFRDLPSGNYEIYGSLTDGAGHRRAMAKRRARVVKSGGE